MIEPLPISIEAHEHEWRQGPFVIECEICGASEDDAARR